MDIPSPGKLETANHRRRAFLSHPTNRFWHQSNGTFHHIKDQSSTPGCYGGILQCTRLCHTHLHLLTIALEQFLVVLLLWSWYSHCKHRQIHVPQIALDHRTEILSDPYVRLQHYVVWHAGDSLTLAKRYFHTIAYEVLDGRPQKGGRIQRDCNSISLLSH